MIKFNIWGFSYVEMYVFLPKPKGISSVEQLRRTGPRSGESDMCERQEKQQKEQPTQLWNTSEDDGAFGKRQDDYRL